MIRNEETMNFENAVFLAISVIANCLTKQWEIINCFKMAL